MCLFVITVDPNYLGIMCFRLELVDWRDRNMLNLDNLSTMHLVWVWYRVLISIYTLNELQGRTKPKNTIKKWFENF